MADDVAGIPPVTETTGEDWVDLNRAAVLAGLARTRNLLHAHATRIAGRGVTAPDPPREPFEPPAGSTLQVLRDVFGLTGFELDVLILCAGVEVDGSLAEQCSAASPDGRSDPTFGLALAALPEAHWSALTAEAPLRHWMLIGFVPGSAAAPVVTRTPIRIDERVLHFVVGLDVEDPLLAGRVMGAPPPARPLAPSHEQTAGRLAAVWARPGGAPTIRLEGAALECRDVAARAASRSGAVIRVMQAVDIPADPGQREVLRIAIERDTVLGGGPLLVEADDEPTAGQARWVASLSGPKATVGGDGWEVPGSVAMTVGAMTADEQQAAWTDALGSRDAAPSDEVVADEEIEALAGQFRFTARDIEAIALDVDLGAGPAWAAARRHARHQLTSLATHVETSATWDDLVVRPEVRGLLHQMRAQVRHRRTVLDGWGMGDRGSIRGNGVSALFSGASGTGKTLAAEVLANELDLDLWRVDLSQVVSKYIGETEKNLRRIFDAADQGGCVLLFDEADALFGKRTEVRDSHDRYANLEVSYLLQLMEGYRGLAVLTTNLKDNLDPAFLRRLDFLVPFPFPEAADRRAIWSRHLPSSVPTRGVELDALADLAVPGGVIRNIALGAAFLAADGAGVVTMAELLTSARRECAKLERPISAAEVGGWR